MTNFWRRLKYYGFGFLLGMLFLVFFFQNRGCSWLPANRVKNTVLDRLIVVSDETAAEMKRINVTNQDLINVLNDGDVDFKNSDKDSKSKVYRISKDGHSYLFTLPYESFISEVKIGKSAKKCKTSTIGNGRIIHFPNDDNLIYPDSSAVVTCQQDALGLIDPREILRRIEKDSWFSFDRSKLRQRPKPEHFMEFTTAKGDTIGITAIWYKNKINVTYFESRKGIPGCEQ
jgi:hypothetical protein